MELNAEQIIKALECCTSTNKNSDCPLGCPFGDVNSCEESLMCHTLSLIKELTEENERWRAEAENQGILWKRHFESIYQSAKEIVIADTVRKMQERLEKAILPQLGISTLEKGEAFHFCLDEIDQIAKEMLEGNDESKG